MAQSQAAATLAAQSLAGSLPPELLEILFLNNMDRSSALRNHLLPYPLVCRAWARPAQRVLFMDVKLMVLTKATKFLRAIEEHPSLSHSTKLLGFWDESCGPTMSEDLRGFEVIKNIVARCPNLYHLHLPIPQHLTSGSLLELARYSNLSSLPSLSLHVVEALEERIDSEDPPATLRAEDFFRFLREFTRISHLQLEGVSNLGYSELDEAYAVPPTFQLYELRYDLGSPISNDTYSKILQWLMGGSATSNHLRVLEVKFMRLSEETMLSRFLKSHGSSLISLCIHCTHEHQISPSGITDVCSGLKALRLPWCFIPQELRDVMQLPRLEHLEFSNGYFWDAWEEDPETGEVIGMSEAVKWVMKLPKLRSVWFHRQEGSEWDSFTHEWQSCHEKGMQVTILDHNQPREIDDFIKSQHFPRGRSVDNLTNMRISAR